MEQIVIATKNEGKVAEMREALSHLPVEVVSLAAFGDLPDAVEDGETFLENAKQKARFYREVTGAICIADDSGLEVEALGGAPGIYSARYAGVHGDDAANNAKLCAELARVGAAQSRAAYRCALAFSAPDGEAFQSLGSCEGIVRRARRGTGGFGYDPYFYPDACMGRSMAEIVLGEKIRISHRGAALRLMVMKVQDYLARRLSL